MAAFISGKDTRFTVYFNNQPFTVQVKSWSIEEVADEIVDDVNGETRGRLMKITSHFKCTFDCYDDGSAGILQNIVSNQANDDAGLPQLPLNSGIRFNYLTTNGQASAFALNNCTFGPMKVGSAGRKERVMYPLSFRAQYFNQVQAA